MTLVEFLVVSNIMLFFVGFAYGMYSERIAWNKLIDQGRIPAPIKR